MLPSLARGHLHSVVAQRNCNRARPADALPFSDEQIYGTGCPPGGALVLIRHRNSEPSIDPTAYVAPSAVLVGDVRVATGARVLHGAVVTAEDGWVSIGQDTVIMEHALVRGRKGYPAIIGSAVMVGPHAHVNGSSIADEVFIATGASLFPGSHVGVGAEVRINGVVQVNTVVPEGAVVPIGWVAVGDPVSILPPERHDEIWAVQRELDFTGTVYGERGISMRELMKRQSAFYGEHGGDVVIDAQR